MSNVSTAGVVSSVRVSELLGGLRELLALTEQLDALSKEQSSHVASSRGDALVSVLSARQTLVEKAGATRDRLAWALRDWERTAASLDADCRSNAEAMIRRIREYSAAVAARDAEDSAALQLARGGVGRELSAIARRGTAARAYSNRGGGSVFHDGEA